MSEGRSINVPLPGPVADALVDLALREYRQPRLQATKLIIEALERAGALPTESSTSVRADPAVART